MKWLSTSTLVGALTLILACNHADSGSANKEMKTATDKVSYALGLDIGKNLKQQSFQPTDLDINKLSQGLRDALSGAKPALTDSQLSEAMMGFQKVMMARQDSLNKIAGEASKKEGDAFLEKNAKEAGVKITASGLQYQVLVEGKGKKPDSSSQVSVHYTGTLVDGTVFDSSVKRGQPVTFPVTGVIPGWTEALLMMTEGSKWKIVLPSKLGYGEQGAGGHIKPNSVLIFEVELLKVMPKA